MLGMTLEKLWGPLLWSSLLVTCLIAFRCVKLGRGARTHTNFSFLVEYINFLRRSNWTSFFNTIYWSKIRDCFTLWVMGVSENFLWIKYFALEDYEEVLLTQIFGKRCTSNVLTQIFAIITLLLFHSLHFNVFCVPPGSKDKISMKRRERELPKTKISYFMRNEVLWSVITLVPQTWDMSTKMWA